MAFPAIAFCGGGHILCSHSTVWEGNSKPTMENVTTEVSQKLGLKENVINNTNKGTGLGMRREQKL